MPSDNFHVVQTFRLLQTTTFPTALLQEGLATTKIQVSIFTVVDWIEESLTSRGIYAGSYLTHTEKIDAGL